MKFSNQTLKDTNYLLMTLWWMKEDLKAASRSRHDNTKLIATSLASIRKLLFHHILQNKTLNNCNTKYLWKNTHLARELSVMMIIINFEVFVKTNKKTQKRKGSVQWTRAKMKEEYLTSLLYRHVLIIIDLITFKPSDKTVLLLFQ